MFNQGKKFSVENTAQSLLEKFAMKHKFGEALIKEPNILVIVQDKLGQIVCLNEACEHKIGTFDQVNGKCIWDLFMIPEEVEKSQAVFQEVLSGKYPVKNDSYLVDKNGNYSLISWLNTALTNSSDCVDYIVSIGFDMMSHFQSLQTAELERENEKKFRAIFDNSSAFMALLQPDGQFIQVNQTFLNADSTLVEIADKYLWEMQWQTNSIDKTKLKEIISQVAKGESVTQEIELLLENQNSIFINFSLKPFKDETGKVEMLVFEGQDITEKKQVESQVLSLQRFQSIGMLVSGVVHDLNDVFSSLLGIIYLLKKKPGFEKDRVDNQKLLNTAESHIKQTAKLVKQVSSFLRHEKPKFIQIQFRQLIVQFEDFAKNTFSKSIQIQIQIPSDLWLVKGNLTELYQVVMNLCINARDAMPKGGTLTISANNLFFDESYVRMYPDAKIGAYIKITVSDTGSGMNAKIKDKIFEPFFSTKSEFGTGLGLSMVKKIVINHDGFINVCSEAGKGTIFEVYLPAL